MSIADGGGNPTVDVVWTFEDGQLNGTWDLNTLDGRGGFGSHPGLKWRFESHRALLAELDRLGPDEFAHAQHLVRFMVAPSREMRTMLDTNKEPIRLVLWIRDRRLAQFPWEVMSDKEGRPIWELGGSLVRTIEGIPEVATWEAAPKVLVGGASPNDPRLPRLTDAETFVSELGTTIGTLHFDDEPIQVEQEWPVLAEKFNTAVDTDIAILVGHGISAEQDGGMFFGSNGGAAVGVNSMTLAESLRRAKLAVLISCYGGGGNVADASLAERLIDNGVRAVVAFNGLIDWRDAQNMTSELVSALFAGSNLEDAVTRARRTVMTRPRRSWAQLRVFQQGNLPVEMWQLHRPNVPDVPRGIVDRVASEGGLARRTSLENALRSHLHEVDSNKVVIFTGDPGDGKTSFLVSLLRDGREALNDVFGRGSVVHAHWCVRDAAETQLGKGLVTAWSTTLAASIPSFGRVLDGRNRSNGNDFPSTFGYFMEAIAGPLTRIRAEGFAAPVVLVVDALDEAVVDRNSPAYGDPIVGLLTSIQPHLPERTHIICTSRVDAPVAGTAVVSLRDPEHAEEVEAWLARRVDDALSDLVAHDRVEQATADALRRCRQNFLVARSLARVILDSAEEAKRTGTEPVLDSATWPASLADAFASDFMRLDNDEAARQLVKLVSVAQEGGIPGRILLDLLGPSLEATGDSLSGVLTRSKYYLARGRGELTWQLFHDAFSSFVRDLETEDPAVGRITEGSLAHRRVASLLSREGFSWDEADDYLVVAGPTHLAAAAGGCPHDREKNSMVAKLASICFDINWIERRVVKSSPDALLADLRQAQGVGVTGPPPVR